jgi:NTP pyrophosphatase (non-canonical NTP hydrolase)
MKIDLDKYSEFVGAVTSQESQDLTAFMNRLDRVDGNYEAYGPDGEMQPGPDCNVPLLLTSAIGMAAETGEFCEIPKKIFFQGKNLSEDARFHMKRELGDVFWYWINACRALNLDPNDVIAENVRKLEARYPGGNFDPYYSENRQQGDI